MEPMEIDIPSDDVHPKWWSYDPKDEFLEVIVALVDEEEWKLFFNSSKCMNMVRERIVSINPYGDVIPMSYRLSIDCNNNMVEYEALILVIKVYIPFKVQWIRIFYFFFN